MEKNYDQADLSALQDRLHRLEAREKRTRRNRKMIRIVLAGALFLVPVLAYAVTITKPYTFVGGQPISASELNENFDVVYDRVNELGMYKAKVGTTVIGDVVFVQSPKSLGIMTPEGYFVGLVEQTVGTVLVGGASAGPYYAASDCSGSPILGYMNTKTVVNTNPGGTPNIVYGTTTHPGSVPGYFSFYGSCMANTGGPQTTDAYVTTAANNASVTGVPTSFSGNLTIELQ